MSDRRPSLWYRYPRKAVHEAVFEQVDYIDKQQTEQRDDWVEFEELYAAGNVAGLGLTSGTSQYFHADEGEDGAKAALRFNLAAMGVDTAASLVCAAPSVPQYLTTDGDFKLIRQAEKCSQVLQGQIDESVREVMKRAWTDAAKLGTGFIRQKFCPVTGRVEVERVHALQVFVEHMDGLYMKPRSIHIRYIVPKDSLAARSPKWAEQIENAAPVSRTPRNDVLMSGMQGTFVSADWCYVVESWYLRSTPKEKGRHTISISTATLHDTDYNHDAFPLAVFRYRERAFGFYGSGLIESCRPAQYRINALIRKNARAQDLASTLIVANPNGEGAVSNEKLTNELALIVNYEGPLGPPTMLKWEGSLNDLIAQVDLEVERWLMSEGISASQANGAGAGKGLDSGVAVRAADDVQSRRLVPIVTRYQQSCLQVARLYERANDDLAARDEDYTVQVEGTSSAARGRWLKTSRWLAVRPPKNDARLTMAAMSAMPTTPQARFAAVMNWVQAGFASRQYAMTLLEAPDLDAYASTELAHLDFARWQVELILDGKEAMPDPRQDLNLAVDLATKSKLKAATMGADESVVDAFESFIVYCEELIDQAMAQEAAKAAPPGGAPGAPGMVDPTAMGAALPTAPVAPGLSMQ